MSQLAVTQAVRFHQTGGPEVLVLEEVDLSPPNAGEIQIEHKAIGLNFIEIYLRTGLYPAPLPACPGTGRDMTAPLQI